MRDIGVDWLNREEQKDDYKERKKVLLARNRDFPRRSTAPTLTQLTLLRRMVWFICCPKSEGMQGGLFKDKDLKKEWSATWIAFYKNSFFYEYLLSYHQSVRTLTDMSHLWYREFYLEMTKSVQFPIGEAKFVFYIAKIVNDNLEQICRFISCLMFQLLGMSMPWIMTEFLINTNSMKENIFFPFDIYNDAASRALV